MNFIGLGTGRRMVVAESEVTKGEHSTASHRTTDRQTDRLNAEHRRPRSQTTVQASAVLSSHDARRACAIRARDARLLLSAATGLTLAGMSALGAYSLAALLKPGALADTANASITIGLDHWLLVGGPAMAIYLGILAALWLNHPQRRALWTGATFTVAGVVLAQVATPLLEAYLRADAHQPASIALWCLILAVLCVIGARLNHRPAAAVTADAR